MMEEWQPLADRWHARGEPMEGHDVGGLARRFAMLDRWRYAHWWLSKVSTALIYALWAYATVVAFSWVSFAFLAGLALVATLATVVADPALLRLHRDALATPRAYLQAQYRAIRLRHYTIVLNLGVYLLLTGLMWWAASVSIPLPGGRQASLHGLPWWLAPAIAFDLWRWMRERRALSAAKALLATGA
ncbi:MAG: hypothetical protein AAF184_05600 [Pseudomonadota bacterium]